MTHVVIKHGNAMKMMIGLGGLGLLTKGGLWESRSISGVYQGWQKTIFMF